MAVELELILERISSPEEPYYPWSEVTRAKNRRGLETPVTLTLIHQLLQNKAEDPEALTQYGMRLMGGHEALTNSVSPKIILPLIPNQEVRNTLEIWCIGNNLFPDNDSQDEEEKERVGRILDHEAQLIESLAPWMNTLQLSQTIAAIRGYRTIDPSNKEAYNTLVSGMYRLSSKYLGVRRHYRRENQLPKNISIPELPPDLMSNPLVRTNFREALQDRVRALFNKDPKECLSYLENQRDQSGNSDQVAIINEVIEYWKKVTEFSVHGFKKEIAGSQKDKRNQAEIVMSSFPSRHQQEYGYRLTTKEIGPVDLLIGDTGTMKTNASLYGIKAAGGKSTIVLCPATLRDKWEKDIYEVYDEPVDVIKIESEKQLKELANTGIKLGENNRFVIISYSLLSRLSLQETPLLFRRLKRVSGSDSLIADEVHMVKNADAKCTQQAHLLSQILSPNAPRIAMTATGVVNSVEDLDSPIRFLLPHEYKEEGSFTRAARNDPYFVRALLHGKQLMTRWNLEDILGEELPPTEKRDELVPLSPFHQFVYEYVYNDDTIEDSTKRNILRQAALDPQLMKFHYTDEHIDQKIIQLREKITKTSEVGERVVLVEKIYALEERKRKYSSLLTLNDAILLVESAYRTYFEWALENDPDRPFDEDFLAEFGYGELALWSFFNLPGGVQDVVNMSNDNLLKKDWHNLRIYSSKYRRLIEMLKEFSSDGPHKTIIVSGFFREGVTSTNGDKNGSDDEEIGLFEFNSLHDILKNEFGSSSIRRIDGTVSIEPRAGEVSDRERIRLDWRNLSEVDKLLMTTRAGQLGIDCIPLTDTNIVRTIHLDLPDTHAEVDQVDGRTRRKGQRVPNEIIHMKAVNREAPHAPQYGFIDHGMWEAVEFKRLLSQMILDGVPLTTDEEQFVRSHLINLKVTELFPQTPKRYLIEKFFPAIRGKGYEANRKMYEEEGFEGMTNAEFFARAYGEYDDEGIAGDGAKVVVETIKRYLVSSSKDDLRIASIGAGAGILERTLGQPVIDLDMLFEILQIGRLKKGRESEAVMANAANIPIASEAIDVVDLSLMVHWTKNASGSIDPQQLTERIRVIAEAVRVTKINGLVTLTVPASYLTPELFKQWKSVFEKHLNVVFPKNLPSGLVHGTDYKREPLIWILNGIKTNSQQSLDSIDPDNLTFEFEKTVSILRPKENGNRNKDRSVNNDTTIPHSEFEITDPSTGEVASVQYTIPTKGLEDLLSGDENDQEPTITQPTVDTNWEFMLISEGSTLAEQGYFRNLVQYAQRTWDLSDQKAQKLAYEAATLFEKDNIHIQHRQAVEQRLHEIMNQLLGGDTYES